MELILIVKASAETLITMPSSAHHLLHQGFREGARPLPQCSYSHSAPECTLYSIQYSKYTVITHFVRSFRTKTTMKTLMRKLEN